MKWLFLIGIPLILMAILIWQWNGIFYNFQPFGILPKAEELTKKTSFEVLVPKTLPAGFSYQDYGVEGQAIELHLQKVGKKFLLQERLESPQNDLFPNQNIFEQSRKLDDQLVQSSKQDTIKELSVKSYKAYLYYGAGSARSELKWDDEKRFMWIVGFDNPADTDLKALAESLY